MKVKRTKGGGAETRAEYLTRYEETESIPEIDWPEWLDYLWDIFWQIGTERQDGPNGPQPLTSPQIQSWLALRQQSLNTDELETLSRMDQEHLTAYAGQIAMSWRPGPNDGPG